MARIAVLTGTVYGAGKSAGHIEILDDPKGIAKAIVRQVIIQSHVPDEENPEPAGYLTKEMPERQRVEAVGKRYGPGMDLAPYTTKLTESAQAAQALAKVAAAGAARL